MQDIINSIKAYLYDRATSPLMGVFLVSWAVINYRFWLILFAEVPLDKKFTLIEEYYWGMVKCFSHRYSFLDNNVDFFNYFVIPFCDWIPRAYLHGFLYPVAVTIFYIYFYPSMAKPVLRAALKNEEGMLREQKEARGKRLLSEEDSAEIMAQIEVLGEAHKKKVEELKVEDTKKQGTIEAQKNVIKEKIREIERMAMEEASLKGSLNNFLFLHEDGIVNSLHILVSEVSVFEKINLHLIIGDKADKKFRKVGLFPVGLFEGICSERNEKSFYGLKNMMGPTGEYYSLPPCLKKTIESNSREGFFNYIKQKNYKQIMPKDLERFYISHDPSDSYSLCRELFDHQFLVPDGSRLLPFDKNMTYKISEKGIEILNDLMNSKA